jgi:hypothetical protein
MTMAKFGLFFKGSEAPQATFDGGCITTDREIVQIRKDASSSQIVAVISLEPGYHVKKVSE